MYSGPKWKYDYNEGTDEKISREMEVIKKSQKVKI